MNRRNQETAGDSSACNDSPLQRASFFEPGDSSPGNLTGIILAGGKSRRMGERNKAFLELNGRSLIEIVIERVQRVCAEVLIVAGDTSPYAGMGVPLVEDRFHGVGVLGGLHAGLETASHELALVVGCDMPFLNPNLLHAFAEWAEGFDVVVLRHAPPAPTEHSPRKAGGTEGGQYIEPLHAAYRRTCLPAIETAIRAGERRIVSFFSNVRVRYVTPEEVTPIDPDLHSFHNINTPDEWTRMQA
ncbi:MAG: molybdenum cofactor guanylyltransferase [Anaerolineae bacterium]|nr:molybdenum cofactor guanylyltransferase [Anaerolineae bacterium]